MYLSVDIIQHTSMLHASVLYNVCPGNLRPPYLKDFWAGIPWKYTDVVQYHLITKLQS